MLLALFAICLLLHLRAVAIGWNHSILDRHPFRQTQTAAATRSLLNGAPLLAYEVPVYGKPWPVPIEFPFHQAVVAGVVRVTGAELESAGRAVGLAAFYLMVVCLHGLLRLIVADASLRLIPLCLVLASPLYVFWTRAFLIESTALMLAVAWVLLSVWALRGGRVAVTLLAMCVGVLAALTKITTMVVAALPLIAFTAEAGLRRRREGGRLPSLTAIATGGTLISTAFAAGWIWSRYAATVRMRNPMAAVNLSPEAVSRWVVGTLEQKGSWGTWELMMRRSLPDLLGFTNSWPVILAVILALVAGVWTTDLRWPVLVSLAAFAAGPLFFTNVYFVHDYYFYANGVYLLVACGLAAIGMVQKSRKRWYGSAGIVTLGALIALMFVGYYQRFYVDQSTDRGIPRAVSAIRRLTAPSDVVVMYGEQGSPSLSYYSARRALLDDWPLPPDDRRLQSALALLRGERIGAVVVSGRFRGDRAFLRSHLPLFNCTENPVYSDAFTDIYLPRRNPASAEVH